MTCRSCSCFALLFVLALAPAAQTTWTVDDDGVGGSGTAAEPFATIQEGIDAAVEGDLVLVLPGTYFEHLDFKGKDITVRSAAGAAVTVVDGSLELGSVVSLTSGEGPNAVLEGFTIQEGLTESSYGGSGVFCDGASPTIAHNVIRENIAEKGAGIYLRNAADARIVHNVIVDNTAYLGRGGGIYAADSSSTIVDNIIGGNLAEGEPLSYGGGLYLTGGTATIEHNLIADNDARFFGGGEGGGIYLDGTAAILDGNTIAGNYAPGGIYSDGFGGGIACYGGSSPVWIKNTILWGNVATHGGELFVGSGRVVVVSSCVRAGQPGVHVTGGSLGWGNANLDVDPRFKGFSYHLFPSSPMIDAGAPGEPPGGTDFDGDPRILDGLGNGVARVDIGWDEVNRTHLAVRGAATLGGTLTLTTSTDDPNQLYILVTSETPGDLSFGPLGSLLLDLATLQIIALGITPATNYLTLPAQPSLAYTELYTQSLAIGLFGSPGSFSNRLRFVLVPDPAAP